MPKIWSWLQTNLDGFNSLLVRLIISAILGSLLIAICLTTIRFFKGTTDPLIWLRDWSIGSAAGGGGVKLVNSKVVKWVLNRVSQ